MDSNQNYCIGGGHFSQTVNQNVYEKVNFKAQIIVKAIEGSCSICGQNKSRLSAEKMKKQIKPKRSLKRREISKNCKLQNNHSSPMLNLLLCGLNNKDNLLKVFDMCPSPKCKCQKQLAFTPNQFQFEGAGFKNTKKKLFKGSEKAWNSCLKPGVNILSPVNAMAIGEKSKNPRLSQNTTNISNNFSGGRVLKISDCHGNG